MSNAEEGKSGVTIRGNYDELKYSGVVHSEMKGAYSNVNEVMANALNKMLYPDTCYQYESGGDPKYIPDLDYEEFHSQTSIPFVRYCTHDFIGSI